VSITIPIWLLWAIGGAVILMMLVLAAIGAFVMWKLRNFRMPW